MQFRRHNAIVPQEFIRQFYFKNPFPRNWRALLPGRLGKSLRRIADTIRRRRQSSFCLFCRSGRKKHTHYQIRCNVPEDLKPVFVVERGGKIFFDGQRKERTQHGVSLGKEPALHTRNDSFIHYLGKNKALNEKMRSKGTIRKAYWPTLLFGWQAGLSKYTIRALLGVTSELTRDGGKQHVLSNAMVPLIRSRNGLCPELDSNEDYIVFGGNRKVAKGQGYALFGRTDEGWVKRLGLGDAYEVPKSRKSFRMFVAKFVFETLFGKLIPSEFQLTVAAYHSGKNEWKGLDELRRACRNEVGFDWIDKATIRIYAPCNWSDQWRAYLSQQLGYSWIPADSSECFPTHRPNSVAKELLSYLQVQGITREQLSDQLTELAGQSISPKKIQRYVNGQTQTPEFERLLSNYLRSR